MTKSGKKPSVADVEEELKKHGAHVTIDPDDPSLYHCVVRMPAPPKRIIIELTVDTAELKLACCSASSVHGQCQGKDGHEGEHWANLLEPVYWSTMEEYFAEKKRPWPWPDTQSIWDDAGPKETVTFEVEGVSFRVTPTKEVGSNSGRTRYKVFCLTCEKQVHPATTGPENRCKQHLRKCRPGEFVCERCRVVHTEGQSHVCDWCAECGRLPHEGACVS